MKSMRCVVVGIGGIGSWFTDGLARSLEFQAPLSSIVCVDGDSFEPKNAIRQNFATLGNKAESFRDMLQPRVPTTFLIARPAWIVSAEAAGMTDAAADEAEQIIQKITAHDLLEEHDWVFVTVDNFACRKLIFDAAKDYANIDIFTGGNGDQTTGDALEGSAYHYRRRDGEDITLHPSVVHAEFENPQDRNPGEMSCAERAAQPGGTQLIAINMHVASILLGMVARSIFGTDEEKQEAMAVTEVYTDMAQMGMSSSDRRITVPVLI